MSSIIAVLGGEGFVISSDSIVLKHGLNTEGVVVGKVKGTTRKLFQIHEDVLAVGLGNWNSYFPVFNSVAATKAASEGVVADLQSRSIALTDAKVYIFSRSGGEIRLDIVEGGQLKTGVTGAVNYPDPLLNSLFMTMYESEAAQSIRMSGMLGMAALVAAYNSFALSLCNEIAAPFDTVLFTPEGILNFSGGVTKLPVGSFI